MRAIVLLPLRWQLGLGRCAGRICRLLLPGRRAVTEQNLAACFPQMPAAERRLLRNAHFEALGMSIVEMAMAWYGNIRTIEQCVSIGGLEHLSAAIARGNGVILFSAHFTSFEIFYPVLRQHCPRLSGMYKLQRNPLMNEVMTTGRGRNFDCLFQNVREMLRELGRNAVVWYASDQKYAGKSSALIPFFGEPAMTNTAIGRIAKRTGAVVLPYFCKRLPGAQPRYVATIGAPLPDFSDDNTADDIARFHRLLEAFIRTCPEQYWWIHQRFKGRPESLPDIYANGREAQ